MVGYSGRGACLRYSNSVQSQSIPHPRRLRRKSDLVSITYPINLHPSNPDNPKLKPPLPLPCVP